MLPLNKSLKLTSLFMSAALASGCVSTPPKFIQGNIEVNEDNCVMMQDFQFKQGDDVLQEGKYPHGTDLDCMTAQIKKRKSEAQAKVVLQMLKQEMDNPRRDRPVANIIIQHLKQQGELSRELTQALLKAWVYGDKITEDVKDSIRCFDLDSSQGAELSKILSSSYGYDPTVIPLYACGIE